jgi:hypothetical protein
MCGRINLWLRLSGALFLILGVTPLALGGQITELTGRYLTISPPDGFLGTTFILDNGHVETPQDPLGGLSLNRLKFDRSAYPTSDNRIDVSPAELRIDGDNTTGWGPVTFDILNPATITSGTGGATIVADIHLTSSAHPTEGVDLSLLSDAQLTFSAQQGGGKGAAAAVRTEVVWAITPVAVATTAGQPSDASPAQAPSGVGTPEPGTLVLAAVGLVLSAGATLFRRRKAVPAQARNAGSP